MLLQFNARAAVEILTEQCGEIESMLPSAVWVLAAALTEAAEEVMV